MKKYLITALLALGTAALFAACGSSGGGSSTPTNCYNYAQGYNVNGYNTGTCATSIGTCPANYTSTGSMCCPIGGNQAQCLPLSGMGGYGQQGYYGGGYYSSGYYTNYGVPYVTSPYSPYYNPGFGPQYYGGGYYGNGSVSIGLNIPL